MEQVFIGGKLQRMPAFLAAFCLLGWFSGFVWCVAALLVLVGVCRVPMLENGVTCDHSTLNPCHRSEMPLFGVGRIIIISLLKT